MRKAITDALSGTMAYTQETLDKLDKRGYKFFHIKGLTIDKHYDYTEPYYIILVPIKALPEEQKDKDIFEPINSNIFAKWVNENNEYPKILVAVVDK